MRPSEDTFTGGVFHPDIPDGRAGATIELHPSTLVATTADGSRHQLRYDACSVRVGGASGRMVFCRTPDERLTIFCEDKRFLAALRDAAGGILDEPLAVASADKRRGDRRSRHLILALVVGFLLLLVGGYFAIVAAGKAAIRAAPPSIDKRIGELAMSQMDFGGPELEDPTVVDPLDALIARLDAIDPEDPFDYRLTVIEADTLNAFALPGGHIAIYTGLLETAETPEQVAGVLAHEIAHVRERHGIQGVARSLGLVVAIQVLIGDAGGLAALAAEFGRFAAQNAYSRDQEADSDRLAIERLHAAGIDPAGLAGFFLLLEAEAAGPEVPAWFSTHPQNAERIAAIREQVAALPPRDYSPAIPPAAWTALRAALGEEPASEPPPAPQTEETSDGRDDR
ncbi:MAG: M48 family metallopeptidase [Planctomycetota bacterium]